MLAVYIISILGRVLTANAIVSQSTYYGFPPRSEITCIGHIPDSWLEWDTTFRLPYPYHTWKGYRESMTNHLEGLYHREGASTTLAQFCAHSLGVTCMQDEDLSPQHLEFPLLVQLEARSRQGEIRSLYPNERAPISEAYLSQLSFKQVQAASEFCRNKCACTLRDEPAERTGYLRTQAPSNSSRSLGDGNVLEWNFDNRAAIKRVRRSSETSWWKNGLVPTTMTPLNPNPGLLSLAQYYVGDRVNKPICNEAPLSPEVVDLFQIYTNEEYATVNELCSHRYYGGNNITSLGGVCLLDQNGNRQFAAPYELRSPMLTREYPRPQNMQSTILPGVIEGFCKTYCHCEVSDDPPSRLNSTMQVKGIPTAAETWAMLSRGGKCTTSNGPGSCPAMQSVDSTSSVQQSSHDHQTSRVDDTSIPEDPITNIVSLEADSAINPQSCPKQCTYTDETSKPTCGTDVGSGCKCRAFESIDPVFPATKGSAQFLSWCVSAVLATAALSTVKASGSNHFPRDIQERTGACPCNMTYVSTGCCESGPEGLVWEDVELKLGEIKRVGD